jgi:long-chain acyl-CoA synthetase
MLKTNKFVLNVVMVGNKRKFPSLLVVPDVDAVKAWAEERNISFTDTASLLGQADVAAKIEREVMGSLLDLASFELPKKIALIEEDFTIEAGELTPTLKVKRSVVEEKYADRIEAMYRE